MTQRQTTALLRSLPLQVWHHGPIWHSKLLGGVRQVAVPRCPTHQKFVLPTRRHNSNSSLQKSFERRGFQGPNNNKNNKNSNRAPFGGVPYYIWVGVGGTVLVFAGCCVSFLDTVPLTHRRRWIATSPHWEQQMGDREYQTLLRQFRKDILPPDHRASRTVQRIGHRIAMAALEFAQTHDLQQYPRDKPYTYTVIRSDMANAFVLPGNHVFVMTGLFQYAPDEDALAAVLSHEAAHNLARHAGEKVSSSFLIQLLARLSLLLDPSGVVFAIFLPAASLLRELPHSRVQETEADEIGVHLAALACFDPRAAKRVFGNMKKKKKQNDDHGKVALPQEPPEFLSTHPSHKNRIAKFDDWLPDAMDTYTRDYRCQEVREAMKTARQHAALEAFQREEPQQRPSPEFYE